MDLDKTRVTIGQLDVQDSIIGTQAATLEVSKPSCGNYFAHIGLRDRYGR